MMYDLLIFLFTVPCFLVSLLRQKSNLQNKLKGKLVNWQWKNVN